MNNGNNLTKMPIGQPNERILRRKLCWNKTCFTKIHALKFHRKCITIHLPSNPEAHCENQKLCWNYLLLCQHCFSGCFHYYLQNFYPKWDPGKNILLAGQLIIKPTQFRCFSLHLSDPMSKEWSNTPHLRESFQWSTM